MAKGIVLDGTERQLDELNSRSPLGFYKARVVLTDRRVHIHKNEFMGQKVQRTFDLRHVQSIDYGREPNVGAWTGLIVFGLIAFGTVIGAANTGAPGLFVTAAIFVGLTVLCGMFLFTKKITISAPGQELGLRMYRTTQDAINEFGRNVLRTKDSAHDPARAASSNGGHEARLARLTQMLQNGLISKPEYDAQRAEILRTL